MSFLASIYSISLCLCKKMPLVAIKLLGKIGQRYGREFKLDVHTPAEAIRALCALNPDFESYIHAQSEVGVAWRVVTESPEGLEVQQLHFPIGSKHRLVLAPQVGGAGNFGKILLGVALIGAAFLVPGGFLGLSSTTIGLFGASLVLSGISGLLSPKASSSESDDEDSYLFDSAAEVGAQGDPVPVLYGKRYCTDLILVSSSESINEIPV